MPLRMQENVIDWANTKQPSWRTVQTAEECSPFIPYERPQLFPWEKNLF